jgi:hypothetical protein
MKSTRAFSSGILTAGTERADPTGAHVQWVLAVPKRLRCFLQRDADLQGAALPVFLRVVEWSNPCACRRASQLSLRPRFPAKQHQVE